MNTDEKWDRLLGIHTTGRDDSRSDTYHYPYEPTPYSVLERLASSGLIRKGNHLLDMGCGKGRVDFFLAYETRCACTGIDFDARMIEIAERNRLHAVPGSRVRFINKPAENCKIPDSVDRIYFFNPFSTEILLKVLARIRASWYRAPRTILLFIYYPSFGFRDALTADPLLVPDREIDCRDLFKNSDPREQILVFRTGEPDRSENRIKEAP